MIEFRLTDPAAWTPPGPMPMQQHPTYGAALARLGCAVRRVTVIEAGLPIGTAQIVSRRFGPIRLSLLSRGPLWAVPPGPDFAARTLRSLVDGVLVATPGVAVWGRGIVPLITPRHQAVWDLTPPPAALRAGLHQKWRNRLNRAEAEGLILAEARDPAWLLAAEAAQRRARGYRALPPAFVAAWQIADPAGIRLWEAWRGTERLAAVLVLIHRPWASYHIGWSGPLGRAAHAHNLLLWQAALALKAEGIAALDLGDVNTEDAPGLARFKIGTGARVAPLGPTCLALPIRRRS
jgi:Acetyltransferase (GNAT) domain